MQAKLADVLSYAEKQLGRRVVNLMVIQGIVMNVLPMGKTRSGEPKLKFVLGFDKTKSLFICTKGKLAETMDKELAIGDIVRVVGRFHTAHWEENGEKRDAYECHALDIEWV